MKKIFYVVLLSFAFFSCEKFDEQVLEVTGLYDANIVGVAGPYTISVSYDRNDKIFIEAPFDGFAWTEILADVDDQDQFVKDIDIYEQQIGPGVFIWGDGFYNDGVLQLEYTIDYGFDIIDFKLVGQQFN